MSTVYANYQVKISLALALILLVTGCAAPPSAQMLIPATGAQDGPTAFAVHEYPLVEQSIDSPTHAGFQERVPAAVTAIRGVWRFPGADLTTAPNRALAHFGYRLEPNPAPPFSSYALYQGELELQRDIARFWPVSIKDEGAAADFLLAFETISGERLVASTAGIDPWPGQEQVETYTPPVYYQGRIAYAQTGNGAISVIAGGDVLYAGDAGAGEMPQNLITWGEPSGGSHWALEMGKRVILNGQDFNQVSGYKEVFHWQIVYGQPFFFFNEGGLIYLNYAGRVQPFYYDYIIHGSQGEASLFNPGGNERMVWFYALRDGLWYYVEAQVD